MISYIGEAPARVQPRGLASWFMRPWRPIAPGASAHAEPTPSAGRARRVVAQRIRLSRAVRLLPTEAVLAGPATAEPLQPVRLRMPDPSPTQEPRPETAGIVGAGPGEDAPERDNLAERLWAILQPPLQALVAPGGALDWPAKIRPFQMEGIAVLLERPDVLLADEMGLGKTIQAIAALRVLAFRGILDSALVVCPASLLLQWYREFERWAPDLVVITVRGRPEERATLWHIPAHARLVSYETLRADVMDVRDSPALRHAWGVVVLDEASRIKNRDTGISMACRRLPRRRRWVLTGTPLENRPEDVATILEFLLGDPDRPRSVPTHPHALREHLGRVQLRRKKADVLPELPPKDVQDVWIELHPRQRLAYDEAERDGIIRLQASGEAVTVTHVLELISRLKQICNRDPVSSESAKLDDMVSRIEEIAASGARALIFSQYTDERFGVEWIANELAHFRPITFTGAMSSAQRQTAVDEFVRDPGHRVMVLSLRAGGLGLNLQTASYVFHMDRWWNPAIETQAEDRAHRMGQPVGVTVYRYVCAGTIEERIDAKLREKRALFDEIVDDVSLDLRATLTEEDLFGLFGLRPPRRARVSHIL